MEIPVLSYINGREHRIITLESNTQKIKELIKEFCRQANIKAEDEHRVSLYYQAKVLNPEARICDCNLYCESAVTAVLRKEEVVTPVPTPEPPKVREIDYPSPPLPSNDKYFVYCPKHETGQEVNKAGLRPYCIEDRSSSVFISSEHEIKTWEDVRSPKNATFECYSTENPRCATTPNSSIGYYFVCQGDFVGSKWKEEDYKHHPDEVSERRKRSVCKSYSYCGKSNFSLIDLVDGQNETCCITGKKEKIMIRYNPCGHILSFDAAKDAYKHVGVSTFLLKNINANNNLFGKYLIACPRNNFQCNGAILLPTIKVLNLTLYGEVNQYTVGLDYNFVECHSKNHVEVNKRFQLLEQKKDTTCPSCKSKICIACGSDWGDCEHSRSDSTYASKILNIALDNYRRCPEEGCNIMLKHNRRCAHHYICYFCLEECEEGDCPVQKNSSVEKLKQDSLWDLHREYSNDSTILVKVWEQLVKDQDAWDLWEETRERGTFRQ